MKYPVVPPYRRRSEKEMEEILHKARVLSILRSFAIVEDETMTKPEKVSLSHRSRERSPKTKAFYLPPEVGKDRQRYGRIEE